MAWNQNFGEGANQNSGKEQQAWRDNFNNGQPAGQIGGGNKAPAQTVQQSNTSGKSGAPVPAALSKRPAAPSPVPAGDVIVRRAGSPGSMVDYTDMIHNGAPIPRQRPGTMNEDVAIERALQQGITLDQIAAGAIGAGAALVVQRLFAGAKPNSQQKPDAAYVYTPDMNKPSGGGPRIDPQGSGKPGMSGDILTRNGLTQGMPSNNPDIDAQFYEIFGISPPVRPNTEPRLLPNGPPDKGALEGNAPPLRNTQSIPGPNQNVKQLGDMDSPTYRDNFGYNEISQKAEEVVTLMRQYGITDPSEVMDVSADPAVARQVRVLLNSAF